MLMGVGASGVCSRRLAMPTAKASSTPSAITRPGFMRRLVQAKDDAETYADSNESQDGDSQGGSFAGFDAAAASAIDNSLTWQEAASCG